MLALSVALPAFPAQLQAGDFALDLSTFDWPAGNTGPLVRTLRDQYGFEVDAAVTVSGPLITADLGGGNVVQAPDDLALFGGNAEALVMLADAPPGQGDRGDSRITTTVSASSGGNAVQLDNMIIDIVDIDPTDAGTSNDRCDFITAFGDNGNPTLSTLGAAPTVVVGPGIGSGNTGVLLSNEAQCIYNNGPAPSPTSDNDTNGSIRLSYPNDTSQIEIWYDESIGEVRSSGGSYNPGARGVGLFSAVEFTTDQSISLTRSTVPSTATQGETVTFTYIVTNNGELPFNTAQDMVIEDDLVGTVTCPAIDAPLAPGGTVTCTTDYTISAADVLSGAIDSTATAGIGAIGTPFVSRLQSNTENASIVTNVLSGNNDPLTCTPTRLFDNTITQISGSGSIDNISTSDVFVIEDVASDTSGNNIDMVFQVTDISNAANVRVGNSLLAEFIASDDPYVQYRLRMVQDGSATASTPQGTAIEQSRINGVIIQQTDVDSRNETDDSSDVAGALLTPDNVSLFNLVPLASFPAPGVNYVMDPTLFGDPATWTEEPNQGQFDNFVTYEYDSFVEGEFIHGYTGSSTTVATGRGAGVYFCAISATSATVVAEDDDYTASPLNTVLGGTAGDVLSNDTVNGLPAAFPTATLEVITAATPQNTGDPVPVLETAGVDAGRVVVPSGVPAGFYEIEYELCDSTAPGECDRAKVTIAVFEGLGVDFGDAPLPYLPATHGVPAVPTVYLGAIPPDVEAINQSDATATGDDLVDVDDEDAVVFPVLTQGVNSTLDVPVSGDGYLQAWIDFNGDGVFEGTRREHIARDRRDDGTGDDVVAGDGVIQVRVRVPTNATTSLTFARFRYASLLGTPVAGLALDGEVEDYSLVIAAADLVDRGDAPESYGDPRHIVVPLIYLGAGLPDTEPSTSHSDDAQGDDLSGNDDEDSIAVFPVLEAGTTVSLTVQTHETLSIPYDLGLPVLIPGITNLQVWIDWDQNGSFDVGEQVATDYRDGGTGDTDGVFNNQISLNIPVPNTIRSGVTYARVRWSTTSAVAADPFDGLNFDGEVEDYQVLLSAGAVPFVCNGTLYRVVSTSSQLQELVFSENGSGGYSIADANVGSPAGIDYNAAWGYNALDGLFYGVDGGTRDLVRLDSGGNFSVIATIPATASVGSNAGDIMDNGVMIYRISGGGAFQLLDLSDPFNPVDLGQITYSETLTVADYAFNPNDGFFYGINSATDRLFYFDPNGGTAGSTNIVDFGPATFTSSYGAVWFDLSGRFYINENSANDVFEVDVGFEGSGDGAATLIDTLSLPIENRVDAAACPSAYGPLPPTGTIRGLVFNDSNASGFPDGPTNEPGFAGITVSAYDNNNTPNDLTDDTLLATTETDSQGRYSLEDLSAVVLFRIEVDEADPDLPAGAQATTENPYTAVRVAAGSVSRGYNFGFASSADLSLDKRAQDASGTPIGLAAEGTAIDFVLSVSNDGPSAATGVQVRDLIPSGFTYVSDDAAAQSDSYDPGTGVWVVGDVANGTTETLTIRVTMNATGEHTNDAEIIASDQVDPDSDPSTGALTDDLGDEIADDDEASVTIAFDGTGATLAGVVFLDNGSGAGTAYDGQQATEEPGTGAAKIEIFDSTGTLVGSPVVAADGTWTLTLPEDYLDRVTVTVTPATGYWVVSEDPRSPPGLDNPDPLDGSYSFQPGQGADYTDLRFGLVSGARLSDSQQAATRAGQVVQLRHEYIADAEGTVQFSTALIEETTPGLYAVALFYDPVCDGTPVTAVDGPATVTAATRICLVARVTASAAAAPGSSIAFDVLADTSYGTTGLTERLRNTDVVRVEGESGRLELTKTVRNLTQGTPEGVSNGATLGDVLEYRIYLANPGNLPATQIVIHDRTPPYTELAAAIPSPVTVGAGVTCSVAEPAANGAGYAGPLRWDCTGTHAPGATGSVAFQVSIAP
ncbi:GEVED domain-containing protein [Salipiger sp. 1_MG-2023]|uniref:GEVED domain-containing protein n=1 Tax=Salipiger sp. 1_MG-2023 TaxID=3062665 RepID=UPI0026E464EF|nr:GEVED domain-containing protein [Salipiger sp. 1_MG-2023]MDO6587797.1 GEVED domain-containing protein [Salipiger sp. 1_MG-2023]